MPHYKHLFGPVPSRRFGRSLGVDLTPPKTCSFDCIFCQLGRTTHKTDRRDEYVPVVDVIGELRHWLQHGGEADYISLSGSGEPTLHSRFGEVIAAVKEFTSIPVALLTNGTTLGMAAVAAQAARADVVKLSLSAEDQTALEYINRPVPGLRFEQLLDGMRRFREVFAGQLWVEVMLLSGVNTTEASLRGIAGHVSGLRPDRIHLNTTVRPAAESYARAVSRDCLERAAGYFTPAGEVIAEFSTRIVPQGGAGEQAIVAMLCRRPCTLEQVAAAFGMHANEAAKYLGKLVRSDRAAVRRRGGTQYYTAIQE